MKKGFTLIELLVVVLIIGILAAIALPQYTKTVERSRAAEAMSVLKAINDAQQRFFLENQTFTADLALLDIEPPGTPTWFESEQKTRYVTNNFVYASSGGANGYVNAYRGNDLLTINQRYGLTIYQATGRRTCGWSNSKYEPICRSLGIDTTAPACGANCYVLK